MNDFSQRPGEVLAARDPANEVGDAYIVFIGSIETPWRTRKECPKNIRQAREREKPALIIVDEPWRPGLKDLEQGQHIILLYWMHEAPRNLIIQVPRHKPEPVGVFSLRSPARPNPIAMATVKIMAIDLETGRIKIDAIDCLNGTPLLDIKPWIGPVDTAG
ncbi:MAG: tRNA (N6-threonylcarbamoyladenosine(37)-N6)-methyltransferase TrmO [Hyphomicrobiales bacterium]